MIPCSSIIELLLQCVESDASDSSAIAFFLGHARKMDLGHLGDSLGHLNGLSLTIATSR